MRAIRGKGYLTNSATDISECLSRHMPLMPLLVSCLRIVFSRSTGGRERKSGTGGAKEGGRKRRRETEEKGMRRQEGK